MGYFHHVILLIVSEISEYVFQHWRGSKTCHLCFLYFNYVISGSVFLFEKGIQPYKINLGCVGSYTFQCARFRGREWNIISTQMEHKIQNFLVSSSSTESAMFQRHVYGSPAQTATVWGGETRSVQLIETLCFLSVQKINLN